jgi:hypothetical protein
MHLTASSDEDLVQVLGYLNFSSGVADPKTLGALNRLYGLGLSGSPYAGLPVWLTMQQWLQDRLKRLMRESPGFATANQAQQVMELVWGEALPAYLDFHRDLLFHQEPEGLFNGFFLGRMIEAVISQGGPREERQRIVSGAIRQLNDYVGYRPVAVLEGHALEPYSQEWSRPMPLYIAGVGSSLGPYEAIVSRTLEILEKAPERFLRGASFDLDQLRELSLDVRAYDFDHPVNRRPNYQFGQWDPTHIDGHGLYDRFVVQQVTVDALLARCVACDHAPPEDLVFEAAAVLAGTILMASTICGSGPGSIDSTITLNELVVSVARNRDDFYDWLLAEQTGARGERLRGEAEIRRQAFGGARQYLNAELARQRASQLTHIHLARLFARVGSPAAAKEESDLVKVPAARLLCRIDCLITTAGQQLAVGDLPAAAESPAQIFDLLQRGIQCGAMIDPWNILGFAGNFPLHQTNDASIRDHRAEDLVELVEQIFSFLSRLWREAAAGDQSQLCESIERQFQEISQWWLQYAPHTIDDLQCPDPRETFESARLVASALRLWHRGGAAAGDIRFWAPHAAMFDSPKAYALVIEALLEREDHVGSTALLAHWLSQSAEVGLASGQVFFSDLARQCLQRLLRRGPEVEWRSIERFFDVIEANADSFWTPPRFNLARASVDPPSPAGWEEELGEDVQEEPESQRDVVQAAYEGVVFQDSAEDGQEGPIYEPQSDPNNDELQAESRRLSEHIDFLSGLAQMWKWVALSYRPLPESDALDAWHAAMERWSQLTDANRRGLMQLVDQVRGYRFPVGGADQESIQRYDRTRLIKESLLERLISATIDMADARRMLLAAMLSQSVRSLAGSSGELQQATSDLADAWHELPPPTYDWYPARRGASRSTADADAPQAAAESDASSKPAGGGQVDRARTALRRRLTKQLHPMARKQLSRLAKDERMSVELVAYLLAGDAPLAALQLQTLLPELRAKRLLYVPLARGGNPAEIFRVRLRRRLLTHLLSWLPRAGLIWETIQLVEVARFMEHHNPVGTGAVTEFDELFEMAYKSVVRMVVLAAHQWQADGVQPGSVSPPLVSPGSRFSPESRPPAPAASASESVDDGITIPNQRFQELEQRLDHGLFDQPEPSSDSIVPLLEQLTELMLASWLSHSRTLRLSALETVEASYRWENLKAFIERYGGNLFTQSFFHLPNVRGILHQGVKSWLRQAAQQRDQPELEPLLQAIDSRLIEPHEAARWLSLVLESIIDHYAEYRDYNSTTTQSDRGEMLYMFLDFLRLRVRYDRVCWNLKPVFWSHEVLVRSGCQLTAQQWRRALAERIAKEADQYIDQLKELQRQYAMQLPTVVDRLSERFVKPMSVDRMRALIQPAMRQLRQGPPGQRCKEFELLVEEARLFSRQPSGVGLDVPDWLQALDDEVHRILDGQRSGQLDQPVERAVPLRLLTRDQIESQLAMAAQRIRMPRLPKPL